MTRPIDAADIRRRHAHAETSAPAYSPDTGICANDRQKWPCETIRLLDALQASGAQLALDDATLAAVQLAAASPAPRFDLLLPQRILTAMWWEQRRALITALKAFPATMPDADGVALIAAERKRQVAEKGYTREHDAAHRTGGMARAAACYALHAAGIKTLDTFALGTAWPWPWLEAEFKPGADRVQTLARAGALIAAEIDRLRADGRPA
jgi:hypothetical protein